MLAVDVSDEYLAEFMDRLNKHGVNDIVTFIQVDAVNLKDVLSDEAYIRLHRESGDSLFEPHEIIEAMKAAKLTNVFVGKVETNIWFSPDLAKQDLSHAQVWFDADVEKSLGKLIDKHSMKYPAFLAFSGVK